MAYTKRSEANRLANMLIAAVDEGDIPQRAMDTVNKIQSVLAASEERFVDIDFTSDDYVIIDRLKRSISNI